MVFSFKAPLGVYQATIGRSSSKPPAKVNTLRAAVNQYLENADSLRNFAEFKDSGFGAVGNSHPFGDEDKVAKGAGVQRAAETEGPGTSSVSHEVEALEESSGAETA